MRDVFDIFWRLYVTLSLLESLKSHDLDLLSIALHETNTIHFPHLFGMNRTLFIIVEDGKPAKSYEDGEQSRFHMILVSDEGRKKIK